MKKCVECGKILSFFEGYRHPTLGKENLLCFSCFNEVQQSVDQWRKFVLSNSFNPESSTSTLSLDWSFLFNKTIGFRKNLMRTEKKRDSYITQSKICGELDLRDLHYDNSDTLVQLGRRSV
jgi:hypothetical protein